MLLYIVQVNIAWLFCFMLYRLCRGGDTFFQLRRVLLLVIPLFALVYPLLRLQLPLSEPASEAVVSMQQVVWMPAMKVVEHADTGNVLLFLALIIYIVGVVVLLLRHVLQTIGALRLIMRAPKSRVGHVAFRKLPAGMAPFSFFGWLCLPEDIVAAPQLLHVLRHERVHMRQMHSLDVLALSVLRAFCWINPASWMTLREIRTLHEYLADGIASRSNARSYQYALLGIAPCSAATPVVNNFKMPQPDANTGACARRVVMLFNFFNHLPLKRRIIMINKKKTRSVWRSKYLLLAPAGLLLVALSQPINAHIEKAVAPVLDAVPDVAQVIRTFGETEEPQPEGVELATSQEDLSAEIVASPDTSIVRNIEDIFTDGIADGGKSGLVVVDGSVIDVKRFKDLNINTDDILSITVLSGEKGAKLWGSRGQNGVIVVETKNAPFGGRKTAVAGVAPVDTCKARGGMILIRGPQFPGGEVAMRKFIAEHVEYPAQAIERGIQGTAMVTIEVGPDGSITDSWVSNEVNPLLKEAALNVVKQFPKLVPAQTDGWSNVSITMDFPIEFCLR